MSWLGAPAPAGPSHSPLRQRHVASAAAAAASSSAHSPASRPTVAEPAGGSIGSRGWVRDAFRRFGEHCARNQIRTLLIDCLVMTTLFYPSFAAFLEKHLDSSALGRAPAPGVRPVRNAPFGLFSTPVREIFLSPPPPLLPTVEWGPWWAAGDPGSHDAAWASVRKGGAATAEADGEIDVLRVVWADVGVVLDGETLPDWELRDEHIVAQVRSLAEAWHDGARCVRHLIPMDGGVESAGPCYLLVPGLTGVPGSTPLSALWETFGEAGDDENGVAVPFHVSSGNRTAFEEAFSAQLAEAVKPFGAELFTETYLPNAPSATSVSFSSTPYQAFAHDDVVSSSPPRIVFVGYAILLFALLFQLSNVSKVHSRFGLAFTGVVQLCCSAVMSFSVLALLGWNGWGWSNHQTVLPTYVLPFVIIIVGVENMSALTKAVFSVPFDHSVPVRIGIGLSKVGSQIALTSLTDLALLGIVWLCVHLRPVREFCVFASVVIVTDWFMLNTFFLTVLSIDAQRLELADVLASNGGLSSTEAQRREEEAAKRRASRKSTRFSWRTVLRGRTIKSGSLILMLTCVGVLYYYTERGRSISSNAANFYGYTPTTTMSAAASSRPTSHPGTAFNLDKLSASQMLWQAMNPAGLPSVRINMPPSSIVVFPQPGHSMLPADIRKLSIPFWTLVRSRVRPMLLFARAVIVPQASTALALYILLLFLLKDSDLLATQRSRLGRNRLGLGEAHASDEESDDGGSTNKTCKTALAASVSVHMLPASHEMDVDVIATSNNGRLAVSVGVDNSVCIWRFADDERSSGTRELVTSTDLSEGDPIVSAAVAQDGDYVAIATRSGAVELWSTAGDNKTASLGVCQVGCSGGRVTSMVFDNSRDGIDDPFTASPQGSQGRLSGHPQLLIALSNGAVRTCAGSRVVDVISAVDITSNAPSRVDLFAANAGPMAVVSTVEGVTLWEKKHGEWISAPLASSSDAADRVTAVGRGRVEWHEHLTEIVVVGRRSGKVEVFDSSGESVAVLTQAIDTIRSVTVATPFVTRCTTCDSHSADGFFVIASTSTHTFIDRVLSRRGVPFCRCPPPRRPSVLEDTLSNLGLGAHGLAVRPDGVVVPPLAFSLRNVSGGLSTSTNASPMKMSSLQPPSNGDFPVSSHGARRLSGFRDSLEDKRPPSPLDRQSSFTALASLSMSAVVDDASPTVRSPWADVEVVQLGAILARDGGWQVLDDNSLVGVRRAGSGIDDSQWELWAVDLSAAWNGISLIVDLASLDILERQTTHLAPPGAPTSSTDGEMSMRARRTERMLSLNGRASFPSSVGSFSVPTHQPLGYVAVRPVRAAGLRAMLAGFGNRVGVLAMPALAPGRAATSATTAAAPRPAIPAPTIAISTPRRAQFQNTPPPRRAGAAAAAPPGRRSNPGDGPPPLAVPFPNGGAENGNL
ncbi:hypothetical protein VHUM_02514 [Vanrija humicola]|uniref:Sterol regulatory element-binding protein cleavage-activating protein n=1 Tax=Vanrija humicola TaxID=5417 RepID=A0A7D8YZU0_VANHU|nr:hypothetical protein VHUM_02514 [Vanrija humicola]